MSGFLGLPNLDDYDAIRGGSNTLEPGAYLVQIIEADDNYKSPKKGTPGLQLTLEAIQGTDQSDGMSCKGRQIRDTYWIPKADDREAAVDFKMGRLKYLAEVTGIDTSHGGINTADLVNCEITLVVRAGKPDNVTGAVYAEVDYIRPAAEFDKEMQKKPNPSPGLPAATRVAPQATSVAPQATAATGRRY
jgi:hypothetical protein